jgi:hypothetical protein
MMPSLDCLMVRLLRYIHPHVSRYAQADVPCRQTAIRRNRVKLFRTVILTRLLFAAAGAWVDLLVMRR